MPFKKTPYPADLSRKNLEQRKKKKPLQAQKRTKKKTIEKKVTKTQKKSAALGKTQDPRTLETPGHTLGNRKPPSARTPGNRKPPSARHPFATISKKIEKIPLLPSPGGPAAAGRPQTQPKEVARSFFSKFVREA